MLVNLGYYHPVPESYHDNFITPGADIMRFLIGLDDTDNPGTSSTGVLARQLGEHLEEKGFGKLESITRHQLIQSPLVPCTTRNSAICLTFEGDPNRRSELEMAVRSFIMREYAPGANAGFAMASWAQVSAEVFTWARLAKTRVLNRLDALRTARAAGIAIAGLTGSGEGAIGALAALGLRFRGEDGRFLWLPNLEILSGIYTYTELMDLVPFDSIETLKGKSPRPTVKINVGEWVRPILREGRCVLLVEEEHKEKAYDWYTLDMDKVRELTD